MPTAIDDLPRDTHDIATWLGEPCVDKIAGIRAWHGDAALVAALEWVSDFPSAVRAPAFFRRIQEMQRLRCNYGHWPKMRFRQWKSRGDPLSVVVAIPLPQE